MIRGNDLANKDARILIIDDEPNIVAVLQAGLGRKYCCAGVTRADEALEHLRKESFSLVLSDIMMPGMTGIDLLKTITGNYPNTVVILVSASLDISAAIDALRGGAFDYITKPFNMPFVEAVVARALNHQRLLKANMHYELHLEELVNHQIGELRSTNDHLNRALDRLYINYRSTLRALARALEARDVETGGHSDRVVAYSLRLGRELGLEHRELIALEQGALLHDIGKIGVPDSILLKRGRLSDSEWVTMREHINHGLRIISDIDFLKGAASVVGQHHEKYNGSGYPLGLRGENIHINARIFAVADALDAITSDRPYRAGAPYSTAREEITNNVGTHFDPTVVSAFLRIAERDWTAIRELARTPGPELSRHTTGEVLKYSELLLAVGATSEV